MLFEWFGHEILFQKLFKFDSCFWLTFYKFTAGGEMLMKIALLV